MGKSNSSTARGVVVALCAVAVVALVAVAVLAVTHQHAWEPVVGQEWVENPEVEKYVCSCGTEFDNQGDMMEHLSEIDHLVGIGIEDAPHTYTVVKVPGEGHLEPRIVEYKCFCGATQNPTA